MNGQSDYAMAAVSAVEGLVKTRSTTSLDVTIVGIRAITFALLDLAQAVREHGK